MRPINFEKFKTVEEAKEYLYLLHRGFENGSGEAGFLLFNLYAEDSACLTPEIKLAIGASSKEALNYCIKAFELLKKEAESGNPESMHLVAHYYLVGLPPVGRSEDLAKNWTDKAADAGFVVLEDLLAIYGNPKSKYYDADKASQLRKRL